MQASQPKAHMYQACRVAIIKGNREDKTHLEDVPEVLVREVCHAQAARRLALQQPGAPLALRVDEDGEARRASHHYAVLHAQLIRGQALRPQVSQLVYCGSN